MHTLHELWQNFVARPSGPLGLRFVLQPAMAALLAIRAGVRDARMHRRPYLWTVLTGRGRRRAELLAGLHETSRVLVLAFGMDIAYQYVVMHRVHPLAACLVALLLGFVPYLLVRGPAARIAARFVRHASHG